jgi:tetratricopeptide (TPR) repeat protein
MTDLSLLVGMEKGSVCKGMAGTAPVRAAYNLLLAGDAEGASTRFQKLLEENPKDFEALAGLAICIAEGSGRFVSATKLAQQAVRLSPKSAAGYFALAYVHLLGSRLEQGYRYLMKAKQLAPDDPRVRSAMVMYKKEMPVVSDLGATHPLNVALGGMRRFLSTPLHKVMALTVMAEGAYLAGSFMV